MRARKVNLSTALRCWLKFWSPCGGRQQISNPDGHHQRAPARAIHHHLSGVRCRMAMPQTSERDFFFTKMWNKISQAEKIVFSSYLRFNYGSKLDKFSHQQSVFVQRSGESISRSHFTVKWVILANRTFGETRRCSSSTDLSFSLVVSWIVLKKCSMFFVKWNSLPESFTMAWLSCLGSRFVSISGRLGQRKQFKWLIKWKMKVDVAATQSHHQF